MSEVIQFKPLAEQPTLESCMAAFPRQEGTYYLVRAYNAGMVPVPLTELLAAFKRYAEHVRRMHIEPQYVKTMRSYLELRCWLDTYTAPVCDTTPYDRREALRESAAKGNRFSADLLKRDYGE